MLFPALLPPQAALWPLTPAALLTLSDSMGCSMPGSSVLHCLPEFASIHIYGLCSACDATRPSHPLLCPFLLPSVFPSILSFPGSQLSASGGPSIGASASVLPMNIQGCFPLGWTGLISLLFKGLSSVFSSTTVWKHQFFCTYPSLWSNSHMCTWLPEKP